MNRRILIVVAVIAVGWLALRPGLEPIGGRWAVGHSRLGLGQSLMRVGAHSFWQRRTISSEVQTYRFFSPDCVVYTALSSFQGEIVLAVCGDRTPVTVAPNDLKVGPNGLERVLKHDTFDTIPKLITRRIPIGRVLAEAKAAPPYDPGRVPRSGRWGQMRITYARFPVGIEDWNEAEHTTLHDAVANGHLDNVGNLLQQGLFPDLRDKDGLTPLMVAIATQSDSGLAPDIVDTLLRAGADVDAQTKSGMTALMYAKRAGATNVYQLLLSYRADTTLRNKGGQTVAEMRPVAGYDPLSR